MGSNYKNKKATPLPPPLCGMVFIVLLIMAIPTHAKEFRNAFISFQYPDNWQCKEQDTEWICKSHLEKSASESVIVFTAKEAGPTDTLESYRQHLLGGTGGKVINPPQVIIINSHQWVASLQSDSEMKNYYTRYLATIKDGIAVAITYTAHKTSYLKYQNEFMASANSLQVIANKTMLTSRPVAVIPGQESGLIGAPGAEVQGQNMQGPLPDQPQNQPMKASERQSKTKTLLFTIAVALAAGALFLFLKMRSK